MKMTKREFIRKLGMGGALLVGGKTLADENVSVGDPRYAAFNSRISAIDKFPLDVPSATMRNGKVYQPAREIPVFHQADVVVVGGGPAGFAAAIASARSGAKTALIERYGSLGGLFTNGMVLIIIGSADGGRGADQKLITRGICEEFINRSKAMGAHVYTTDHRGPHQPTIDPEGAKVLMDRMVKAEPNLDLFYHAWGVDVIQEGNQIKGVVFESKQGRQAILAKQVVDCSGDGDVYFQAGANFRQITHGLGFVYQIGNIDRIDKTKAMAKAADGFPKRSNEPAKSAFWYNCLGPRGNGLDVRQLTAAELKNREEAWSLVEKMRGTPGFEEVFLQNTCSQLGVRASRLLDAEYTLTFEDVIAHRTFDDAIGMSGDDTFTRGAFQIPFSSLLPKGVENVVAAGRCIGVTPNIVDRTRLIPVCMVTGQAAGTAAALAAKGGIAVRNVNRAELRRQLVSNGVYIV